MQSAFMNKTLGVAMLMGAGFLAQHSFAQSANCSYSISNEWSTGATGAITIINTSTTVINGWTVGWQYSTNRLSSSWNANVSGSNPYTASNLGWNGTIQPGQRVSFGFQVDKRGGSAERPTITGSICGGSVSSVASSRAVSSVAISSSAPVTSSSLAASSVRSSVASSIATGQQCNWYGTLYPLCVSTQNGWGWESNKSCISRSTCTGQPAPWGVVGTASSSTASSRPISSSSISSRVTSSAISSSSVGSSIASSIVSSSALSSSVASSVVVSSSSSLRSSSLASSSVGYSVPANNFAVNGTVESGTTNWGARGDATIARTTADRYAGSASLLVSGRTAYWHGATYSVGTLTPGNVYEVAVWVKLVAGSAPETLKLTGKLVEDADTTTYNEYTEIDAGQVSANAWTLLTGTYIPTDSTPFENFIIESVDGSVNVSFYVDNFSVGGEVITTPPPPPPPVGTGLASLADFPIGVAVAAGSGAADILTNTARQNIVRAEFDQIVAENIMKMSYMYSGNNFSFTNADRLVNWALTNGKTVHAHALVWHPSYQLPSWATDSNANFRQDYARHIDTVAAHFAGKVKSWDVVNEALFDGADDDGRGSANGYRQSVFYRQYAGPSYIDEAFRRARAADPTAELYYNDFNTEENGTKTTALVNLVQRLLTNGVPIDGVGFQMHVMNDYPSIANIRASLQKIVALSPTLKIKITELDVRLNNPYDGNSSNDYTNRSDCAVSCAGLDRQKARYKEIVQAYLDIVPPARRGGITVWGIADPDSWFYTHQNLPDWPLLFNDSLQPKPAYQGMQEALNAAR